MDLCKIYGHGILSIGGECFTVKVNDLTVCTGEVPTVNLDILNAYDFRSKLEGIQARTLAYLQEIGSRKSLGIEDVIFNNPATIVKWTDGTKTVVKCQPGDSYNKELGLAMCISKKFFGNKGNFNEVFHKYIKEDPNEVSIRDMKKMLTEFCEKNNCPGCLLEFPVCNCGCGATFTKGMTDEEIKMAYEIVSNEGGFD